MDPRPDEAIPEKLREEALVLFLNGQERVERGILLYELSNSEGGFDRKEIEDQIGRMYCARALSKMIPVLTSFVEKREASPRGISHIIGHELPYVADIAYSSDDVYAEILLLYRQLVADDQRDSGVKRTPEYYESLLQKLTALKERIDAEDEERKLWDLLGFSSEARDRIIASREERKRQNEERARQHP